MGSNLTPEELQAQQSSWTFSDFKTSSFWNCNPSSSHQCSISRLVNAEYPCLVLLGRKGWYFGPIFKTYGKMKIQACQNSSDLLFQVILWVKKGIPIVSQNRNCDDNRLINNNKYIFWFYFDYWAIHEDFPSHQVLQRRNWNICLKNWSEISHSMKRKV